mmetsp:Transcript_4531/g.6763  ORF Transcript_4531/g.6763 Transcript_4531/m.6763 type:complete len:314 (-) Transcript_4531:238-1179(-)
MHFLNYYFRSMSVRIVTLTRYSHHVPPTPQPEEATPDPNIFQLLNLNPNETSKIDNDAIIQIINENPNAARAIYPFEHCPGYPLHQSLSLHASAKLINVLHNVFPYAASAQDKEGYTALHHACLANSSLQIISLLLQNSKEAIKKKDENEMLPLHIACAIGMPTEVITLLVDTYPQGAAQKDVMGHTPLHYASYSESSNDVMKLLLYHYPAAVMDIDATNLLNDEVKQIVNRIHALLSSTINHEKAKEVLNYFLRIKWIQGVAIVIRIYPSICSDLDVCDFVIPHVYSFVENKCGLMTLWEVLRNRQDLLAAA